MDFRVRPLACVAVLVAGCSVLNSFDEVGPIQETGGSGGSGGTEAGDDSGGTSNPTAGSTMTDAGQGGTMMIPEGGNAGEGGTPPVEMGGEGGGGPMTAPPGLIVVAGTDTDAGNDNVLSVLSPQNGRELSRETRYVPMFAHDGIRDLWYVATAKEGKVELTMRKYNRVARAWTDEGPGLEIPGPADTSANGWVSLRNRFAYISKTGNNLFLVVIDSTDSGKLTVQANVPLASGAVGLIGSFGNVLGGVVNIVRTNTGCVVDDKCDVTLARVRVLASGMLMEEPASAPVATIPNPNGKGTWGANTSDFQDVVVTPNSTGTMGTLVQLSPNSHAPFAGQDRTFTLNAAQLRGFAYDNCEGIAFVSELLAKSGNTTIYALPPPGGGAVGTAQPPQSAQGVFFEPYTRTLLAPFSSVNNHDILAYNVTGTTSSPKLTKRSVALWSPPANLDPDLVAVASPFPAECDDAP